MVASGLAITGQRARDVVFSAPTGVAEVRVVAATNTDAAALNRKTPPFPCSRNRPTKPRRGRPSLRRKFSLTPAKAKRWRPLSPEGAAMAATEPVPQMTEHLYGASFRRSDAARANRGSLRARPRRRSASGLRQQLDRRPRRRWLSRQRAALLVRQFRMAERYRGRSGCGNARALRRAIPLPVAGPHGLEVGVLVDRVRRAVPAEARLLETAERRRKRRAVVAC